MISINPDSDNYHALFVEKQQRMLSLLERFSLPKLEAFASPPLHFRMRAEFKIWHQDEKSHYAIFDRGAGQAPSFIEQFPIASEAINKLMPQLQTIIESTPILRHKLFQIDFLSTLAGDLMATLIYHKPLHDDWLAAANSLATDLGIHLIGRSRKQKHVLSQDFVTENFTVGGKVISYRQLEGCFSQPNAAICEQMLNWATNATKESEGDLLELYCGNGNFTLPLSRNFSRVLATEISKPLTAAAELNCRENNIENVTLIRMSAEDLSSAFAKDREFRRLKEISLDDYNFSTVFVDPPRSGMDMATTKMVQQFTNILYISCNPETLAENLDTLSETHNITRLAFFDQFPYTHHMEAGALLTRKS